MRSCLNEGFRRAALPAVILGLLAWPAGAFGEAAEESLDAPNLTETQALLLSSLGAEILFDLGSARAFIAKGDGQKASRHVTRARALLGEVRAMSPAVRTEHRLSMLIGEIRKGKAVSNDLLPIYAELDTIGETEEVAYIRYQLDKAKAYLDSIAPVDRDAALKWTGAAEALLDASSQLAYVEIDLPIDESYTLVSRAHERLRHNDLQGADAALAKVKPYVDSFVAIASRSVINEGSNNQVTITTLPPPVESGP